MFFGKSLKLKSDNEIWKKFKDGCDKQKRDYEAENPDDMCKT